jgi:hypothetical protein
MDLYPAGRDQLGRRVHIGFIPRFEEIRNVALPQGPLVVLLGGPTSAVSVDVLYATAEHLLDRGAVYIMCWGEGAERCEEIVDEAVVMRSMDDKSLPQIMTTAHERDTLDEVLEFATTVAVPAEPAGEEVVLLFWENVGWYDEARRLILPAVP